MDTFDPGRDERSRCELGLDRRARDERNPETGLHRASNRLLETELEPDVEIAEARPGSPQLVLDDLSHPCTFLHHDQLLGTQLVERHRPICEVVTWRAGEDHLVLEERLEPNRAVPASRTHDPQLELSLGNEIDDRLRVVDRQRDLDARVRALELAEQERDHDGRRPGRRTKPKLARDLGARLVGDLVDELLLECEQALGASVEPESGLGRLDPPARAIEELRAEPLLERPDLEGDGRLGDPEPLRRLREALPLDHGAERSKLARVHKDSLSVEVQC